MMRVRSKFMTPTLAPMGRVRKRKPGHISAIRRRARLRPEVPQAGRASASSIIARVSAMP
ncbi:hypothetical protein GCM10011587_25580 [Pyruvatibacter mobilis]|nr:hypothetical protein GCM10011587_25580 [Pyruvatibacter mobilis]